jgi:hypothetical protein
MKKLVLIAAIAGLAVASCKKEYTCECKTTSSDPDMFTMNTSGTTGKVRKKDAKAKCNEGDMTYTVPSYDENFNPTTFEYKVDCNLK